MVLALSILLTIFNAVLLLLTAFFGLEVLAAFFPAKKPAVTAGQAPGIAVIIPAHNEGQNIVPTINDVRAQLKQDDRVIVIADNCDDDTAAAARAAGAECLERNDAARRGKGYALQFALDALKTAPPEAVFFIDADCRLHPGALECAAAAAIQSGRPVQTLYLMQSPEGAPPQRRVAEFAWVLMNKVRMGGLYKLFDVCRLTGAGMAFPWNVASTRDFSTGSIVEDLAISVALAKEGLAPAFCPDALVTSAFPVSQSAADIQRARWEHGSMNVARKNALSLFGSAIARADLRLGAMALDLAIPPLSVLFAIHLASLAVSAPLLFFNAGLAFALAAVSFSIFIIAAGAAWAAFGRTILPVRALGEIVGFLAGKTRVYGAGGRQSTKRWTRTGRDGEHGDGP